ncbi:rhomboid family intramembrane serine protease [Pseudomonas sp. HMWF032]|uniref:rhomboid family intramembrane serine protease n=1 Tax=unclassified Pseudomonas TaxID=196821 RepID=UPI000D35CADF|nr:MULTISPECIES: rhomboid family intramembrane serine protease [unclassified Pseudomonas]PTS82826.1 rhomboid family intramembrane serine protease [Pseudomonas sp. HMWF032]PTT85952.1 rhomboid family intramembrane serine protease [Pseudomonas sp. HMWF010]WAC43699.1 rhomboid family intramembrane serine protease [Pseudomonas sp. SL4(2022)]
MSAVAAMRLPEDVDLTGFITLLQRLQVPHRVAEEAGEQVLWVQGEPLAEQVRELYGRYPQGDAEVLLEPSPASVQAAPGFVQQLKSSPLTAMMLALTFLVFAVTGTGENYTTIRWFSFVDFRIQDDHIYLAYLNETLASSQWWRLLTPMLIHFGILHLAMNSLWYWELGRRIEARQGAMMLLGLTLLFSLAANFAQYLHAGPSLFGGLSGVLYGLLGHCWIFQRLAPTPAYRLPPGVLVMMLAWLLICMTGIFELLQFGAIANAAHVGGLLSGCLTGLLGGLWARRRYA